MDRTLVDEIMIDMRSHIANISQRINTLEEEVINTKNHMDEWMKEQRVSGRARRPQG